ncbi:MAG: hypothetical protein IJ265_00755 [Oscillospiraceae bacterium]|nr:hypothetical protein [Oscillospiraceae bacterium]
MIYPKLAAALIGITMLANQDGFTMGRDNWCFPNSTSALGENYFILDADYETLLSNLKNTEKKSALLQFQGEYNSGCCYGMSATAVLAYYGLIDYSQYCTDPDAEVPDCLYDMAAEDGNPTSELISLINYYQASQCMDVSRQYAVRMVYEMSEQERLQYLIDCVKDGSPVVVTFWGNLSNVQDTLYWGGHAVVAYGVEYGEYTVHGKKYDGRVLIYNNAAPMEALVNHNAIYFDTTDWSWYHQLYKIGSADGAILSHISGDPVHLNSGGMLEGTEVYDEDNPFIDVLVTTKLNSDYSLQKIDYANGVWIKNKESMGSCKQTNVFYVEETEEADQNFLLPGEGSGYVLEMELPQSMEAAMYYENSIQYVRSSNSTEYVVHPSGYAAMMGSDAEYTLEMVFNEGHYQGSWYDFSVSGTADSASLQKTEEGWIITSDNLQNVTAKAGNDEIEATLTFSADADSVLLYEADKSTLAAKIDTDGDGTYETKLSTESETSIYGDFNSDGLVNAVDAALILQYAAYAGSGGTYSFIDYIASFT